MKRIGSIESKSLRVLAERMRYTEELAEINKAITSLASRRADFEGLAWEVKFKRLNLRKDELEIVLDIQMDPKDAKTSSPRNQGFLTPDAEFGSGDR